MLVLSLVLSALLLLLSPHQVHGITSIDVQFIGSRTPVFTTGGVVSTCPANGKTANYILNTSTTGGCLVQSTSLSYDTLPITAGNMLEVNVSVYNIADNNSLDAYTSRLGDSKVWDNSIGQAYSMYYAGSTFEQLSASNGQIKYLFYIAQTIPVNRQITIRGTESTSYAWLELKPSEAISVDSIVLWQVRPNSATAGGGNVQWSDLRPHLNEIQLEIRNQSVQNTTILNQQLQQQQATTQAIETQTQQQQTQYEQEKQEEQERENQGNADSGELQGLFSFTAFNPFSGLFGLFTSGSGCVSIPTIASMLRSPTSTYCPWFSSTVRSILTPVIGISAMMIIFGFFIRWLNSGSGKEIET